MSLQCKSSLTQTAFEVFGERGLAFGLGVIHRRLVIHHNGDVLVFDLDRSLIPFIVLQARIRNVDDSVQAS